jgi:hypothetical protein
MKTYNKIILTVILTLIIGYILYKLTCQFKKEGSIPGESVGITDAKITPEIPEIEIKAPMIRKDPIDIAISGN